jgi:Tfp pilus assembly protein PilZ
MRNEKRESVRVIKRLEVKILSNGEQTAITSDLSENGLFIRTGKVLNPGSSINFRISLPDRHEINLSGRVVRSKKSYSGLSGRSKSGMGIQLIDATSVSYSFLIVLIFP